MPNNEIYFLRHAKSKKDETVPQSKWVLSDDGLKASEDLNKKEELNGFDLIISSDEEKAFQTAKVIADKQKKEVIRVPELNELNRDKGGFLDVQEYSNTRRKMFLDPDFSTHGWETVRSALTRFKDAVEKIDSEYEGKKILIVTHGTVMTLYFAMLQDDLPNLLARWKKLNFCEWGVVENRRVLKDVI